MSPCHLPIIILVAGGYSDECRNVVEDIRQKKKNTHKYLCNYSCEVYSKGKIQCILITLNRGPFLLLIGEKGREVYEDLPEEVIAKFSLRCDVVWPEYLTCQEEKKDAGLSKLGFAGLRPPMYSSVQMSQFSASRQSQYGMVKFSSPVSFWISCSHSNKKSLCQGRKPGAS